MALLGSPPIRAVKPVKLVTVKTASRYYHQHLCSRLERQGCLIAALATLNVDELTHTCGALFVRRRKKEHTQKAFCVCLICDAQRTRN